MKTSRRRPLATLGSFLVALLPGAAPGEAMYHVTDLSERYSTGLNNAGQVAGTQYAGGGANYQPFLYSGYGPNAGKVSVIPGLAKIGALGPGGQVSGTTAPTSAPQTESIVDGSKVTVLDAPAGGYIQINSLNAAGQGAGLEGQPSGFINLPPTSQAVLVDGGKIKPLPGLGGTGDSAWAINDAGQVTGQMSLAGDGTSHAFLYSGGHTIDLGTLGGRNSSGLGINAAGDVVGSSETGPIGAHGFAPFDAFLSHNGRMTDLGTLAGAGGAGAQPYSEAMGINSGGAAVGDSGGKAVLFVGGKVIDLNTLIPRDLGVNLEYGVGINDRGQILAEGLFASGLWASFLLTPDGLPAPIDPPPTPDHPLPIPEPGPLATFSILAALAVFRSRKARAAGLRDRG